MKSARDHSFLIFRLIRCQLSLKKPALVWSEIWRLFVSTLTADDRYIHRNMQNFPPQLQTPIYQKENTFSGFFISFLEHAWNLEHFEKKKKKWLSWPNYFRNYWLRQSSLLKRLRGVSSEHHSVINMLPGSKHCWSQNFTSRILLRRELQTNWVGKSLP